ncbi:hypothetical protein BC834DRAFT_74044 [Gloeopeniophorella convolvens]|nr:hypothetical protein BC834DRAFT_74044 [Gloeopeniophorella convolvens]
MRPGICADADDVHLEAPRAAYPSRMYTDHLAHVHRRPLAQTHPLPHFAARARLSAGSAASAPRGIVPPCIRVHSCAVAMPVRAATPHPTAPVPNGLIFADTTPRGLALSPSTEVHSVGSILRSQAISR